MEGQQQIPSAGCEDSVTDAAKDVAASTNQTHPPRAALLQPPAVTSSPRPLPRSTQARDGLSKRPIPQPGSWDPWNRYWSSRNSFPKYEDDTNATMKSVKKFGEFFFGNALHGQNLHPAQQSRPPTAKRPTTSDSDSTNPPKRPRIGDDVYEIRTISSSPEARVQARPTRTASERRQSRDLTSQRSTSPMVKKGPHDNQSLLSSGDRNHKGVQNDEYRSTSRITDVKAPSKRARHVKRRQSSGSGHVRSLQEISNGQRASHGISLKNSRGLMQNKEVRGDPIENDEVEIVEDSQTAKRKRHSGSTFTAAQFAMPSSVSESEDGESACVEQDEIARLPVAKHDDTVAHRRGAQSKLGTTKRRASSPDELQSPRDSKRRSRSVGQTDSPRSNGFLKQAQDCEDNTPKDRVLHVKSAVCEPHFIYPARAGMYESAHGASNKACVLSPSGSGNHLFEVLDKYLLIAAELDWITPELSKVVIIEHHNKSPIVLLKKRKDSRGGGNLLIKFENSWEANRYVELCRKANDHVMEQTIQDDKLSRIFDNKLEQVKKSNMEKPAPLSADLMLLSRSDAMDRKTTHAQPRMVAETDQTNESAQIKGLRAQMVGEGEPVLHTPFTKRKSERQRSITPVEQKPSEPRVLGGNKEDGGKEIIYSLLGKNSNSTQSPRTATPRAQRSLRSSQMGMRSLSPPLERWTKQHPTWIEDHNWQLPLIYERTTVNCGDIACLDEGQFLNDAIISFYAKYLHKNLEKDDEHLAQKVYIFNSFFWETLRAKGYDGVKSWTAKINLLSYDYIVVPINQHAHWYLAIICNPGALIPKDESDDEVQEITDEQNRDDGVLSDNTSEAKMANVTSDLSQVSIEDPSEKLAETGLDENSKRSRGRKPKVSKRRPPPRKYDPKAPRVITLDSLDGTHSAVASQLKAYLIQEIKERKGLEIEAPSPFGTAAKDIPMQRNFTDCGVYLLGYIEEFMKNPHRFTRRILQQEKRDWNVNAPGLRNKIRNLIFELQQTQQGEEIRRRRDKKLLSSQKRTKASKPASAVETSVNSTLDIASGAQKASCSSAVGGQKSPRSTDNPVQQGNRNGNSKIADSKTTLSKSPTQTHSSSPTQSPQTRENEISNVNASMIVHPNVSIDLDRERSNNATDRTLHRGRPPQDDQEVVPETAGRKKTPESRQASVPRDAPVSRQTSEPRRMPPDRSANDGFEEKRFLPLLTSSPSASPAPSSRQSVERKGASPAAISNKRTSPKQDDTRSRYFSTPSTVTSSSAKTSNSVGRKGTSHHNYQIVESSDDEEAKRHHRKAEEKKSRPSQPPIDLTDD